MSHGNRTREPLRMSQHKDVPDHTAGGSEISIVRIRTCALIMQGRHTEKELISRGPLDKDCHMSHNVLTSLHGLPGLDFQPE